MTIYDDLIKYKKFKRHDGEIGLEIETETKGSYVAPSFTFWRHEPDGSLRNFGVEYVLKQPVKYGNELSEALKEFEEKTKSFPFIKDSISTSVHVHFNVMNETYKTVANFCTVYTLIENILIRYSGPDRVSNLFCLPICDAEETYENIVKIFSNVYYKKPLAIFQENNVKYAALNLASIGKYGSLEIRTFRGETDIKAIQKWVDILYKILLYSRQDIDPKDIMENYKKKDASILDDIFKEFRKDISLKDESELLDRNAYYAASIAYSVKDWSTLDRKEKEVKPDKKILDSLALSFFAQKFSELTPGKADYIYKEALKNMSRKTINTRKSRNLGIGFDAPIARNIDDEVENDF